MSTIARQQKAAATITTLPCPHGCGEPVLAYGKYFGQIELHDHMRDAHGVFTYQDGGRRHYVPIKPNSPILVAQRRNVDTEGLLLRIIEAMAQRGKAA